MLAARVGNDKVRARLQVREADLTSDSEQHVMDRLVDQRTVYPRSTLLTVAESGLRLRDKWSGPIKMFAEEVADTAPNWLDDLRTRHAQFVAALS